MKTSFTHFITGFILSLLFVSCNLFTDEIVDDREMVDVAYFVPQYETTSQLAAKVSIDEPKDYAEAGKIVTYQHYIFINKPNEGVHVVDNSDPTTPVNLHFINIPGSLDLSIIDNHLYSDMFSALVVFNLSDITSPELIEEFTVEDVFYYNPYFTLDYTALSMEDYSYTNYEAIDPKQGIVTGWEIDIRQEPLEEQLYYYREFDHDAVVAESTSSDQDGAFSEVSTAGSMTRFLPVDRYLYTINFNELVVFSIGENYQPTRFARLDTGTQAETLFQLNDLLFVGSTTGMLMYDISSPSNPDYLNSINHFRSCDPVVADEEYAYVTLRGGTNCFTESNELQIIDIRNPEELAVVARQVMFNPHGLAIHEKHLLVCDGSAGLKVVDVTDPTSPEIVTTENLPFAYDIIVDFPNAIIVGEGVIYQYDLTNLPEIVQTNELILTN
ncbi:MAG: LVIVD repeat-containing protein [Flavobacteriaceae bacterium]